MLTDHILTLIVFVPALGALVVAMLPRRQHEMIRYFTLAVTLLTFLLTLHLPAHFNHGHPGSPSRFHFEENFSWITSPSIRYHVGIDGISLWLVVLTGFLAPLGALASWKQINRRHKEFYSLFLVQQTAMLGVFVALDLFLYYGFWELSLIPMAILIAMFGRERGSRAALKFFVYTFLPSALLLVAILWLYTKTGTFDFVELQQELANNSLSTRSLFWVALAFLIAFAVKVPIFPLHGWLGDVFSEAPTAMAMVVAGKLGLYSILRFNLGLFPAQARQFAPLMIALSVIGILYGATIAITQKDLKRLVAFSTVSHLSFCTLGIFCFAVVGVDGAVYQILNHGISGGAMLILLGLLYERYGTYEISAYGGLATRMPKMATLFVITTLSLIGLPLLNGFIGEFLILSSSYGVRSGWVTTATIGVILSAVYMLWMVQRVFYGQPSGMVKGTVTKWKNLNGLDLLTREHIILWPMAVVMLVMGILPNYWLHAIDAAVMALVGPTATAAANAALRLAGN